LDSAVRAGYWEHGDITGEYRVLVFSGGFEHISSWVVAEWIATPRDNDAEASIVHSTQLVAPGFFSLGAPVMTSRDGALRVELQGRYTHDPERSVSCIFDLLPNGEVKLIKACG
jgi:hypothetical protein